MKVRQIGTTPFAIPERVTHETTSEDLPYDVTITIENTEGEPRCVELVARQRPGGEAITSDGIRRIPVRDLTEWANSLHLFALADPDRGVAGGVELLGDIDEARAAVAAADRERRGSRRRILPSDLEQLAQIVQRAQATGRSYITLAQLEMGITADQARQWKRKAIDAGYLERKDNR